nr:hypothetical protein [Elizabethkingia sp. ASV34]
MRKEGLKYYYSFIGKRKEEVLMALDEKFKYYPDNIWICEAQNSWWKRRTFLILKFDERSTLKNVIIEVHVS